MRLAPLLICLMLAGCATVTPIGQTAARNADQPPLPLGQAADLILGSNGFTQNATFSFTWWVPTAPSTLTASGLVVTFTNGTWTCPFSANPSPPVDTHSLAVPPSTIEIHCDAGTLYAWGTLDRSYALANAWSSFGALVAPETQADRMRFEAGAAMYQAQPAPPAIGEDVRMHKVAAEAAVRERRLWAAVDELEQALRIAPWWPQGNYNIALVYAELHAYSRAARYMQRYLALVPNAENARAAQDKIYIWQAKTAPAAGTR